MPRGCSSSAAVRWSWWWSLFVIVGVGGGSRWKIRDRSPCSGSCSLSYAFTAALAGDVWTPPHNPVLVPTARGTLVSYANPLATSEGDETVVSAGTWQIDVDGSIRPITPLVFRKVAVDGDRVWGSSTRVAAAGDRRSWSWSGCATTVGFSSGSPCRTSVKFAPTVTGSASTTVGAHASVSISTVIARAMPWCLVITSSSLPTGGASFSPTLGSRCMMLPVDSRGRRRSRSTHRTWS